MNRLLLMLLTAVPRTALGQDDNFCSATNHSMCSEDEPCCVSSPTFFPVGHCCPKDQCLMNVTIAGPVFYCNRTRESPAAFAPALKTEMPQKNLPWCSAKNQSMCSENEPCCVTSSTFFDMGHCCPKDQCIMNITIAGPVFHCSSMSTAALAPILEMKTWPEDAPKQDDNKYCSAKNHSLCSEDEPCCVSSPSFFPIGRCCRKEQCLMNVTIAGPVWYCNDTQESTASVAPALKTQPLNEDPQMCSAKNHSMCSEDEPCCVCSQTFFPMGYCCPKDQCLMNVTIAGPVYYCNTTKLGAAVVPPILEDVVVNLPAKNKKSDEPKLDYLV